MSKLIKRQNNLRKAQSRFEKASKRRKQFQIRFDRQPDKKGRYRTTFRFERGVKEYNENERGLFHRFVNAKYRIKGDKPSITKALNSIQPVTFKGNALKKTAQAADFIVHNTAKTAVNAGLAAETAAMKSADAVKNEIKDKARQKYSREAVDDYHRGTFLIGRTAFDAVKGTKNHFKLKKQYRFEKAKYRLKKAEWDIFKEDKFKSEINKTEKHFRKAELSNQKKIMKNAKTDFIAVKPVKYTINRMKISAWQKAVNENSDNDMLHAVDSAKRRIAEPAVQKISKPERLQRQQKKRNRLSDKKDKSDKRLRKKDSRLKNKRKKPQKKKKIHNRQQHKRNAAVKAFRNFIKNVYENEIKKFIGSMLVCVCQAKSA